MKRCNALSQLLLGIVALFVFMAVTASAQSDLSRYSFSLSSTAITNQGSDLTNIAHAGSVDDAITSPIILGFTFYFNGKPYDRVVISSNGWIALGTSAGFPGSMTSVPDNDPNSWSFANTPMIAPLWDNLRVGISGNVSYSSTSTQFKVRWRGMEWPATASSLETFELTLTSGCNNILFSYGSGSGSAQQSATVGIINSSGSTAPNNYQVFNGNVTPGNTVSDAASNPNTRLVQFANLPSGANPSISTNHYDALFVTGSGSITFPAVDANGGTTTQNVPVQNIGCNPITITTGNVSLSNGQFTAPSTVTIGAGLAGNVPVTFTGNCPQTTSVSGTLTFTGLGSPALFYPNGSNVSLNASETHPNVTIGAVGSFSNIVVNGTPGVVNVTLTNSGNAAYNGTLSITGIPAADLAQFVITPSPTVSVPASGSTIITITFTADPARHAANANPATFIATYSGLLLNASVGNQTCAPIAPVGFSATSVAPRLALDVNVSTDIPGNQGIPRLDLGDRIYGPNPPLPGSSSVPESFSSDFLVKNTGSSPVTISAITRNATGTLFDRFSATATLITGSSTLAAGAQATYRITYTPLKTTSDFPYFQPTVYAGTAPAGAFVTGLANYTIGTATTVVPAIAGYWKNLANGANLTQQGTMDATIDMFRGFMRAVAAPTNSANQAPTNPAGAPSLTLNTLTVSGSAATNVGDGTNGGSILNVQSYFGAVGDVLPNGSVVTNAGQPGTVSFYVVNNGTANARFYVRKTFVNDNVNPGAFTLSVPIPGDPLIPIGSTIINGIDYHTFTLEPLYVQGAAGNSAAFVRFDVTFRPTRANTPDVNTIAALRSVDIQILTSGNLPQSATASTEPRNDLTPYIVRVAGSSLFTDPIILVDAGLSNQRLIQGVNFGNHELADASSSNYPFGVFAPAGIGYFAPAEELGRRGLATGVTGPLGFGVRDTVMQFTVRNLGNAPLIFTNSTDLQAFANGLGSPGTFSVVGVTTQALMNAAGNAQPAQATFPFTLNPFGSASNTEIRLWVRYDAGLRSTGSIGLTNGSVRIVQTPLADPIPNSVQISYSVNGTGIRPFPIVKRTGGNAGTMVVVDGQERSTPVFQASRTAIFDNYCNLGGVTVNRDTVQIKLTIGNGIPAPSQAGDGQPFNNVNDAALTDVNIDLNRVVVDSIFTNLVIPGASRSFFVDYSVPVQVRNAFGTVVRTQDVSNPATRLVTLNPNQTMTFTVTFRPASLVPPALGNIKARIRVGHSSRDNNIDFPADQGPSQTRNSNPQEFGDVYKWMDFVVQGNSQRSAFRLELGNTALNGALGNYLTPNSTVNFNLPYPYLPGIFVGDSSFVALTLRNSQETGNVPTGSDVSTGKIGIKGLFIEGADFPDFEIVGFGLPAGSTEPNPVAFPVAVGANNGSPVLVNGTSFIQWTATFGNTELGTPFTLNRNVANNEAVSLYVHFKPRRTVNGGNKDIRNAILRIVTNDLCQPELVYNLQGRALNSELTFDKTTVDFGNVQTNDVAQQTLTMTNTGNSPAYMSAGTLPAGIPSTPLYSHNFAIFPLGFNLFTNTPPVNFNLIGDMVSPLYPGSSRQIAIQYSPNAEGRKDATLSVTYIPEVPPTLNNGNIAQIDITGRGVAPVPLVLNPISGLLDFGDVVVNTSKSLPITITNAGQTSLVLTMPPKTIGDFSQDANTTVTLAAGASTTVNFTFVPKTFGQQQTTFTIQVPNGFSVATVGITVRGRGVSGAAPSVANVDFPITRVFTESKSNMFINNTNSLSTSTVVFNGISGLNSNEYALRAGGVPVAPGFTFSIPAGTNSMNFDVVFAPNQLPVTPSTANIRVAQLNLTINGNPTVIPLTGEGAVPQIEFQSPDIVSGTLDFGAVSGTLQRKVTVRNVGRFPLNITQLAVTGSDAAQFQLGNIKDVVLAANGSIEVTITMTCTGSNTIDDARLTAISNSLDTRSVELTGSCAVPMVGLSTTSVDFGNTTIGQTIDRSLTLTSISGQPVKIMGIAVNGSDKGEFVITGTVPALNANGVTLSGTDKMIVSIQFNPKVEGSKQARLNVVSSVGQTEVGINALALAAGKGNVRISSQVVNFGNLPVGKSNQMSLNVYNSGTIPAQITSVKMDGDDKAMFVVDAGAFTIQPNDSRSVNITFTPASFGQKYAVLHFMTSEGTDLTSSMLGSGGAPVISVADVANFGVVSVMNYKELQIPVTNSGDAPLEISNMVILGADNTDFSIVSDQNIAIASGKTSSVTVRFAPTTDGPKHAKLTLYNNSDKTGVINLEGATQTVGVKGEDPAFTFGLGESFPNPFSEFTTINYSLSARSNVVLKVFNQLGDEVATLVKSVQSAGSYTATLKAGNLASGVYVVRLEAGNQSATTQVTIVK